MKTIHILSIAFVVLFTACVQSEPKLYKLEETIYVDDRGQLDEYDIQEHLQILNISCKSYSMGLAIDCQDKVFARIVTKDEKLHEGSIYLYDRTNGDRVIHRMVKCIDKNCSRMVFKGDNNFKADAGIVGRRQVKMKVYQILYG